MTTIDKTLATIAADLSEKNRDWFYRSALGALCDNAQWNLEQKRELKTKLRAEIKEALDEPSNEITLTRVTKKADFYDQIEESEHAFTQLLEFAKAQFKLKTGDDWKKRSRSPAVTNEGRNIEALRNRFA